VPSHPTVDDLTNSSLWEASRQYGSAPADRPAWPVTTANASSSIFKTALALSDSSSTRRKSGGKTVPTHEPRPGLRSCLRLPGNHRNLDLVLGSSPVHPAMIGSIGAQGVLATDVSSESSIPSSTRRMGTAWHDRGRQESALFVVGYYGFFCALSRSQECKRVPLQIEGSDTTIGVATKFRDTRNIPCRNSSGLSCSAPPNSPLEGPQMHSRQAARGVGEGAGEVRVEGAAEIRGPRVRRACGNGKEQ
jgi:hypothetical protein